MSRELAQVAQRLGCSERTVRRYVREGTLRTRSIVPGRLGLSEQEQRYLSDHWSLLVGIKNALRTERDVRMAVLYGSTAVGEDGPDSDLDLVILRRSRSPQMRAALSLRLRRHLSRTVHLVDLEQAEASPALLVDVLLEGRPLLDRDGLWSTLLSRRQEIAGAARYEERALAASAHDAVLSARARSGQVQAA
jgi:predicted nucleotidyltransferase